MPDDNLNGSRGQRLGYRNHWFLPWNPGTFTFDPDTPHFYVLCEKNKEQIHFFSAKILQNTLNY